MIATSAALRSVGCVMPNRSHAMRQMNQGTMMTAPTKKTPNRSIPMSQPYPNRGASRNVS